METSSDASLVARVRKGDVDAYAVLIQRYQAAAIRLATLVTRDAAEADDVAQEAFIKAYYALERFKPEASFRAWLVRIVVNEARNARAVAMLRELTTVEHGPFGLGYEQLSTNQIVRSTRDFVERVLDSIAKEKHHYDQ